MAGFCADCLINGGYDFYAVTIMTGKSSGRALAIIIAVIILLVHNCNGLKCYSCTTCDSAGYFDSQDATTVDNCAGSCTKTMFEGGVTRGCSETVGGGEICDAAPTITVCYCKSDMCNTGTTFGVFVTIFAATFATLRLFL